MLKRKRSEDSKDSRLALSNADLAKNDVLSGRGDNINRHPGNKNFRKLVEEKKKIYSTSQFKREKQMIAFSIVTEIRELDPPGRFLSQDPHTGKWHEIGDEKAREKTSQALREKARAIRGTERETQGGSNTNYAVHGKVKADEAMSKARLPHPPPAHNIYHSYAPPIHLDQQYVPHYFPPYRIVHQYPYPPAGPMLQLPTLAVPPPPIPITHAAPGPVLPMPIPPVYGPNGYTTEHPNVSLPGRAAPEPVHTNEELKTASTSGSDHDSVELGDLHIHEHSQPEPPQNKAPRRSTPKVGSSPKPDFNSKNGPSPKQFGHSRVKQSSNHQVLPNVPDSIHFGFLDSPGSLTKFMEDLVESPGTLEQVLSPLSPAIDRKHVEASLESLRYSPIRVSRTSAGTRGDEAKIESPIVNTSSFG